MSKQQQLDERRQQIIARRLRAVQEQHDLPKLSRLRMHRLSKACSRVLGEDGIPDCDLRILHKYTSRGLFDKP